MRVILRTLLFSVTGLFRKPHRTRNICIFTLAMLVLIVFFGVSAGMVENLVLSELLRLAWIPLSVIFLITRHGEIITRYKYREFFLRRRIFGVDGMIPKYVNTTPYNRYLDKIRFKSRLHPKEWEKLNNLLEMLLERRIYCMKNPENDIKTIDIFAIKEGLPNYIPWQDRFMQDGRNFTVGEGYKGQVVWNAAELSHGIVAGSTGSGKTALLRCIIHQAIQKKYNVSVLDFKGGGDFSGLEIEYGKYKDLENSGYGRFVISAPEEARDLLLALVVEVDYRMECFNKAGVANIDEYNEKRCGEKFIPWLIAIDEAAEILDVKPKDKTEKELYSEIDGLLRTLARKSRAAGIHLLFGIIRPDANVIDGQIKNNLLWRVCGYFADSAASRIVLDNDKATDLPPNVKGRFVIGEDETQAYYFPIPTRN